MNNENVKVPNKMVFMPTWISLPSEWDASVSDVEMLQGMLYNINCIIQYLEDLQLNYESYTNNAINSLRTELVTKYDNIIADLRTHYDKAVNDLKTYVDTQDMFYWNLTLEEVGRIDRRIDSLITYVNENFLDIRNQHNSDISNIYKYIETTRSEIMNFIELNNQSIMKWVEDSYQSILDEVDIVNEDGFKILNPTTGEKDRVEKTVSDVYDALRVFAITCDEWDNWFLNYGHDGNDFKHLNMSALEFDTRSWIVMYGNQTEDITSPVTGETVSINEAIEQVSTNSVITSPTTGNLSAEMWDSLEFDQNDYEVNYVMSAYEHDFKAAQLFDNDAIKTIGERAEGYTREYTIEMTVKNATDFYYITFNENVLHRTDLGLVELVGVLPQNEDTGTYAIDQLRYQNDGNYLKRLYIKILGPDTDSIYIRMTLYNQPIIPLNISDTNPPKPVPLGGVTCTQWDDYFTDNNGNNFNALDMSAYDFDTNSIKFMVKEGE